MKRPIFLCGFKRLLLFANLLLLCPAPPGRASDTPPDDVFYYVHHRKSDGEISGYNRIVRATKNGVLTETNEMFETPGKPLSLSVIEFSRPGHKLLKSFVRDRRVDLEITTVFSGKRSRSKWKSKTESGSYEFEAEDESVLFEDLFYLLPRKATAIRDGKLKRLRVLFPQFVYELKKLNLPAGLSEISFDFVNVREEKREIDGTSLNAVYLELVPASFFLSAMLPEKLSKFGFLIGGQKPHDKVLEFSDGNTRFVYSAQAPAFKK